MRTKIFLSAVLMFISLVGFSQASTRGALVTMDTTWKPTIKMLAVNMLDNEVVFWDLYSWSTVSTGGSGGSGWSLTGNSGTTAGTNFIGTTDNVGLMFKTNDVQSGYLDVINQSSSFGVNALMSNTTGSSNAAFGTSAMLNNTSGDNNTAVGGSSLQNNLEGVENVAIGGLALGSSNGSDNTALGYRSSFGEQTGSNNISVGSYAGQYLDGFSNRVIINSLDRGSDANDTTKSIIYGAQDATAANQRLYLNSKVFVTYLLNVGVTTNYADNAAALAGGLVVGDLYRTNDTLKIVH